MKVKWRGQVWWPILGICALHLSHPKCTHTAVNTHTPWTHTRSSGQPFMLRHPGEQLWVQFLAQGSHLSRGIEGGRERCTFTPPTYNSCWTWDLNSQPLGYESDSLTIRPRLPQIVQQIVHPKIIFCHHLLTLLLFKTCMTFFWRTQKKIFWMIFIVWTKNK